MKKATLLLGALFVTLAAQAQITLDKKYPGIVEPFKLLNGNVKYISYDDFGSITLYNANYSVYKQVPVTIPNNYYLNSVTYVTERLFNTDANIEMVLNLFGFQTGAAMQIIDENGASVFSVDSTAFPNIYNTPQGTKMVLPVYTGNPRYSKIFALPGTYTPLRTADKAAELSAAPYPNPAQERIVLPYAVKPGEVATLEVLDLTGRVVKSFRIGPAFDHLELDARELRSGTYVYRVTGPSGVAGGKKFVVRH